MALSIASGLAFATLLILFLLPSLLSVYENLHDWFVPDEPGQEQ
jgi:hypothetical protein